MLRQFYEVKHLTFLLINQKASLMIKKALIIAAGQGQRLKRGEGDIPKPLRRVAGFPLIKRIILTAKEAGIEEFVIVVGYRKERMMAALHDASLGVRITFVENLDFERPNGISVLAAASALGQDPFALMMADHVFEAKTLRRLCEEGLAGDAARLALDYKLEDVFDPDDATKVVVSEGRVQEISKSLQDYNAVDTGMFLGGPKLFEALQQAQAEGKESLSDAIQKLSEEGTMGSFDIGEGQWQDVDTPEALKRAETNLLNSCRKKTDGIVSRYLNRPMSMWLTRYLLRTRVTPNQVTFVVSTMGILSGFFVARGTYLGVLFGALLFQLASIYDGCDGEIARMKFCSSKFGQWLDTIGDNLSYVAFFVGVLLGAVERGIPYASWIGSMAIVGLCMSLFIMFVYLVRNTESGSLTAIQKDIEEAFGVVP
jgi:1L-myo-inositol 1-phosphate cytidylyltransferase / CDP-L-myo-inositol myo-inositolphosphotransferase